MNVIHRDLKSKNCLVRKDEVKILMYPYVQVLLVLIYRFPPVVTLDQ